MDTHNKNNIIIVRNTVILTMRMIIVLIISLYTSRIILETLGIRDFGIYNVVAGFVSMFSFMNVSMNSAIQRYYNYELGKNGKEGANKVYNTSLIIQLCFSVIIIILAETIGYWYINEIMVIPPERKTAALWTFQFSVFSIIVILFQLPYNASIVAHEKMDFIAFVSVIEVLIKLLIAIYLPYLKGDILIIYGFLVLLTNILIWVLYFFYSKKHFEELRYKSFFQKDLFGKMIGFSIWDILGSFAFVMKEQGINMVLNIFYGPIVNAARGIVYQVSGAINGLIQNITHASRPQLVQSYAMGNVNRTMHIMFSITKLVYLSTLCFTIPVILERDFILNIWLGENVPQHTSNFIILVVLASLIKVFHPITSQVVYATGNIKLFQIVNGVIDFLVVPAAYLLCKLGYRPESVFVLYLMVNIFVQIVDWRILDILVNEFSIVKYLKSVIIPLIAISFVSFTFSFFVHSRIETPFIRLCLVIFFSFISSFILGFFFALNSRERAVILYLFDKYRCKLF